MTLLAMVFFKSQKNNTNIPHHLVVRLFADDILNLFLFIYQILMKSYKRLISAIPSHDHDSLTPSIPRVLNYVFIAISSKSLLDTQHVSFGTIDINK